MKNAIVRFDYRLDLPAEVVAGMIDPDASYNDQLDQIEAAVRDDPARYLGYIAWEPEIEVDA